ncbi:MAG: DNA mismatch repair endonuclease MutL [Clostridiales bacterium]|nr:DNA mismatch repair endonuclease MutL [Clostridiales bacterium]
MADIQILSQHVANQIAAGEVVERPVSVVKELVENAIDAGAAYITVAIENGGLDSIIVTDDGCGIPGEQCQTAFLRHATSKINSAEDLSHIETLGFRGEALASIAAVATVALTSRVADCDHGKKVVVDCGACVSCEDVACASGTRVSVSNLFLNIPARLKFIKTPRAEAGQIGDYLCRAVLSHPEIAFTYTSNGKKVYETFGDGDLKNAMVQVYGLAMVERMVPVDFDNGYLQISGFVGLPDLSRPTRAYQSLFVNGRSIRSGALSFALLRAYETRLMTGRFPVAVIKLKISSREVDVNVHPAKIEVRFVDEARVANTLCAACAAALQKHSAPLPIQEPSRATPAYVMPPLPPRSGSAAQKPKSVLREPSFSYSGFQREKEKPMTPPTLPTLEVEGAWVIGCAFLGYWILESGDTLYLIDQHAAHERQLYETYVARALPIVSQPLLLPHACALSQGELATALANQSVLENFGFSWEPARENELQLTAVPVLGGKPLDPDFLHDALQIIESDGEAAMGKKLLRGKLITAACKRAVKAGDPIAAEELIALVRAFAADNIPLTCPHGRPVVVTLTRYELEKMFKRIV